MRFKKLRIVCSGALILLYCPIAFTQKSDPEARAREILNHTRAALGGDAVLKSVQSLSAFGNFRSGSGSSQASGDLRLDVLLPDRAMRTMIWIAASSRRSSNKSTHERQAQETINGRSCV
jgi:hypothetical protein